MMTTLTRKSEKCCRSLNLPVNQGKTENKLSLFLESSGQPFITSLNVLFLNFVSAQFIPLQHFYAVFACHHFGSVYCCVELTVEKMLFWKEYFTPKQKCFSRV